MKENKNII